MMPERKLLIAAARWHLRDAWERAGYLALFNTGMALLLVGLIGLVVLPLKHANSLLARQIEHPRATTLAGTSTRPTNSSPLSVAAFRDFLPPRSSLEPALARVHALAAARQVRIERVEYADLRIDAIPADGMGMKMTLHGDITDIRAFIHDYLAAFPSGAIRSLELSAAGNGLPATLTLELAYYVQPGDSHAH